MCLVVCAGRHSRLPLFRNSSGPCLYSILNTLDPVAFASEDQDLHATSATMHEREAYHGFKSPLIAVRMGWHGMTSAVRLMMAHATSMNITYHAALRMRLDLGARSLLSPHPFRFPGDDGWRVVLRHARAAASPAGRMALQQGGWAAALHSCKVGTVPGVKNGDNCFWSAPANVLANVVLHVASHIEEYLPTPARVAGSRRTALENVSACRDRRIHLYPETMLICAMNETRVLACGLNCSKCVEPPSSVCGVRASPYCNEGGPCRPGCC